MGGEVLLVVHLGTKKAAKSGCCVMWILFWSVGRWRINALGEEAISHSARISPTTSEMYRMSELRNILKGYPDLKRIEEPVRSEVIAKIEEYDQRGYLNYITLSASIVFSGRYVTNLAELKHDTLYNTLRQSDYAADGYLDGLTIVHQDYRSLFRQYCNQDGVCFLIDPPYLSTQATTYTGYWKLRDYLDVLHTPRHQLLLFHIREKQHTRTLRMAR